MDQPETIRITYEELKRSGLPSPKKFMMDGAVEYIIICKTEEEALEIGKIFMSNIEPESN